MGLRQAIRRLPLGNVPVYVKLIQKVEPFIDGTDVKFAARWGLLVIGTGLWFAQPWDFFRDLIKGEPEEA